MKTLHRPSSNRLALVVLALTAPLASAEQFGDFTYKVNDAEANPVTEGVSTSELSPDGHRTATVPPDAPRRFLRLVVE